MTVLDGRQSGDQHCRTLQISFADPPQGLVGGTQLETCRDSFHRDLEGKREELSPVGLSETQVHVWGGRNVAHADADANHPSALAYEGDFRLLAD